MRTGLYQQWKPLSSERSLVRELGLNLPVDFVEQGFRELLFGEAEDDATALTQVHGGEVWMFVDIPGPGTRT